MAHMFKGRMFVLFVNNKGFVGENYSIVLNVVATLHFDSHEEAEKHRTKLNSYKCDEFQNTISILEWV